MREQFQLMLALLKKSVPFFSMRYQGHMDWDLTIPSVLGYFATMLYNPNNVALEASTATAVFEQIVGNELCTMVGYHVPEKKVKKDVIPPWGHITCDGTVANIEALWSARNLKFFPVALQAALQNRDLPIEAKSVEVALPDGTRRVNMADATVWQLLNLKADDVLALPAILTSPPFKVKSEQLSTALAKHSVQDLGMQQFYRSYLEPAGIQPPVVLAPSTRHYSWPKAAAVLGVGRRQLLYVPVDVFGRMDVDELEKSLARFGDGNGKTKSPVLQVVAVVGSTEESAVDPVEKILALRETLRQSKSGVEFTVHADAAWGGYFASMIRDDPPGSAPRYPAHLSDYTAAQLAAMGGVDSVTVDPHKAGYVPYPAGALCYRNSAMRDLVTFTAPYLDTGKPAEAVGIYGIEGSKPGAAAAAVYLSHRVIRPTRGGYGRILSEAMYSCQLLHAHLLTLARPEDPFIVVPLPHSPNEEKGHPADDVDFIEKHILGKSREELTNDPAVSAFLNELGPDLNILVYAFNRKDNTEPSTANEYNTRIFEQLKPKPGQDIYGYELILSSTHFSAADYGDKFLEDYARRLGLNTGESLKKNGLRVLRSVVMDPWIAERPGSPVMTDTATLLAASDPPSNSFIDKIVAIPLKTATEEYDSAPL